MPVHGPNWHRGAFGFGEPRNTEKTAIPIQCPLEGTPGVWPRGTPKTQRPGVEFYAIPRRLARPLTTPNGLPEGRGVGQFGSDKGGAFWVL